MNFDPLSFVIGKHGDSGSVRDVVSYLLGRAVGTTGEIWQTLTNIAVASFTAVSATLRELVIDVTPVQSGSGDPSPTNVRPISGWSGANVFVAPIPGVSLKANGSWVGTTARLDNDGNSIQRTYLSNTNNYFFANTASLSSVLTNYNNIPAGKWAFKGRVISSKNVGDIKIVLADGNGANEIQLVMNGEAKEIPAGYYMYRIIHDSVSWSAGDYTRIVGLSIAPEMQTYSVAFPTPPGTVYGGTLRDNGDGTWTLITSPYYASYAGETLVGPWVSSMDVYTPETTPTTGAQVVDLGDTAQTYALTAESVQALIGQNNIFADTGNINTITFRTH